MIPKQLQNPEFRFLLLKPKEKNPLPQMKNWPEVNVPHDNVTLEYHIKKGGNYGIIGGYGNLVIIDTDSEEIMEICEKLPTTFTIKTGSKPTYKKHYFFIADNKVKPIRFTKKKAGDLGDVRSVGQYVVAPNSIHPEGGKYLVIKDWPIRKIKEEEIRNAFSGYINADKPTEFNEFPIATKIRNSRFVRECNVPDYAINNKMKSGSSKNWELFPYLVDILHSREVSHEVYKKLVRTQGHPEGSIKGWVKKAHEGKLMKTSCKKMREHLDMFHPEVIKKTCNDCPLYKTTKKIEEIKDNKVYDEFQKEILIRLVKKEYDVASEMMVEEVERKWDLYTTRDDIKNEVWIYNNGIYVPQGKSFIKEFSRKVLGKAYTVHLVNMIISKVEADTYIEHDEFFRTNYPNEIVLENGILDIETKKLSPYNPKKVFFNKVPIMYDPSAECPEIINHFKTVLGDESDIPVLIELFGFLLYKEYFIEKAVMFVGRGRNGKTKTLELMKKFVGVENCSALPLNAMDEKLFSLSELFGKMVNLSGDLSYTDLKETGTIKKLIGRDDIQAKRKFLRDLNYVNYAKLIFAANELPKVYDSTDGFWTKWLLIRFPKQFISQKEMDLLNEEEKENKLLINPDIIKKLSTSEELSGLLNLALEGLWKLKSQRDFSYSKSTSEVKDLWIRQSDSFTAFCIDHIIKDYHGKVTKKDLRSKYHDYCNSLKIRGCSDKNIKVTLQDKFGASEYREYGGDRFWEGIKLK